MKSGWLMLLLAVLAYGFTFLLKPELFMPALLGSLALLKMMAPILLMVLFLMALMNRFFNPKSIAKHLGEESGFKGWIIALFGGILSHGPSYVWYPMLQQMRDDGAKDGLIVAFFYARSIKIPWLPVMVSYFGITFTIILSIYVILAAWIQGLITQKLSVKRTLESEET